MKSYLTLHIQGQGVYNLVLFQHASFGKGIVTHIAGVTETETDPCLSGPKVVALNNNPLLTLQHAGYCQGAVCTHAAFGQGSVCRFAFSYFAIVPQL